MAYEVVATETFGSELEGLFAYYSHPARSIATARAIKGQLDKAVKLLASFPGIAAVSRKPTLQRGGFREWYFGDYVLVYRVGEGTIYLEHLFHQHRDYERLV